MSTGKRFGVKTSKTLRRCNWRDQAKELDAFVIQHCAQYEGQDMYNDQLMTTNLTHEKIDKSERKRLANKNINQEQLFINMDDFDSKTEFDQEVDEVKQNNE
jgi:hypothetical protein